MQKSACISSCEKYRYWLIRHWGRGRAEFRHIRDPDWLRVVWVMLNPSTATHLIDDQTVRKCEGFTREWGYFSLLIVNLFALRATDPRELRRSPDPVGEYNQQCLDAVLCDAARCGDLVVAAWGAHGVLDDAGAEFVRRVPAGVTVYCLGTTRNGQPRHPLMLPYSTSRIPYTR